MSEEQPVPAVIVSKSRRESVAVIKLKEAKSLYSTSILKEVDATTQAIGEALGRRSKSLGTEEFQAAHQKYQNSRTELMKLRADVTFWISCLSEEAQARSKFTDLIAKLGSHSKAPVKVQEKVQSYVPYALELQGYEKDLPGGLTKFFLEPLDDLILSLGNQIEVLLKKLRKSRIAYDAARNKSLEYVGRADDDVMKVDNKRTLEDCELVYLETQDILLSVFEQMEIRKVALLQANITDYIKVEKAYVEKGKNAINTTMAGESVLQMYREEQAQEEEPQYSEDDEGGEDTSVAERQEGKAEEGEEGVAEGENFD